MEQRNADEQRDYIAEFAVAEAKTVRRLKQLGIAFVACLLGCLAILFAKRFSAVPPSVEFANAALFLVVMLVGLSRVSSAYRCPRCGNRPFHVLSKGLTYSYGVQQSLNEEFAAGRCAHCNAMLKMPTQFVRQRRKW